MEQPCEKCPCLSAVRKVLDLQISKTASHLLFWLVFILGFAADLWTKSTVFKWLNSIYPPQCDIIGGFFRFVLVENRGAAWGIAAGKIIPLIVISVVAIIIVFGVFIFGRQSQMIIVLALGLFAAGICGNLYDRLFNNGRVRDFLDFYYRDWHFPAFNLADSMLTLAVFLLILVTIFPPKPRAEDTEPRM